MSKIASIRFSDMLPLAWSSLRRNRLRSSLTIGAVAVGITLVVYLLSLGFGLEQITLGNVQKSYTLLSMTVETASKDLNPLNEAAITKIKATTGVQKTLPRLSLRGGQIGLNDARANTTIVGVDPDYLSTGDKTQLAVGRYYRPEDTQAMVVTTGFLKLFGLDMKKVPLVLFTLYFDADAYPNISPLTDILVTGVVTADESQAVYLPLPYLQKAIGADATTAYEHIKVVVPSIDQIGAARDDLVAHGFKVTTAIDQVDDIKRAFVWIRGVLAALGLIAILIATIGMFNTMTISLLERTKEIGIMKALGVRNKDVNRLFLTEATLMGLLGGLVGLTGAFLLEQLTVFVLSLLATIANGNVPTIFINNTYLIFGALLFATLIAVATGFYPARRAMRLNPIDAIRHDE